MERYWPPILTCLIYADGLQGKLVGLVNIETVRMTLVSLWRELRICLNPVTSVRENLEVLVI